MKHHQLQIWFVLLLKQRQSKLVTTQTMLEVQLYQTVMARLTYNTEWNMETNSSYWICINTLPTSYSAFSENYRNQG